MGIRESDREILEYRDLMSVPDKFEQGISLRTVVGAFFIGFIMMPGAIYLGLLVGGNLGPAAEWVTIILFTEAARRSFQTVSRQEIYLLYYLAGTLTAFWGGLALAGGPFAALIWNQYFAQSPAAASFAQQIPDWVVPRAGSEALNHRTFMQPEWVAPIVILMVGNVLARVNGFTGAYALFRITSDMERLPFPMAPVAAQGATALAESSAKEEGWRWRVFSIGTMIGLSFGLIYVAV
ncbi:MAG TPA: peptide transporter, partial [Armatimonadota bacterium]|nr:peptide transporter [Armatimonadota bacterium]